MKEVALLAEASGYPDVVTEEVIKEQLKRLMNRLENEYADGCTIQ